MALTAEVRRARRRQKFEEKHGSGANRRPSGPAPRGYPNWDAVNGVWHNNAGETIEDVEERQKRLQQGWNERHRKKRDAIYGAFGALIASMLLLCWLWRLASSALTVGSAGTVTPRERRVVRCLRWSRHVPRIEHVRFTSPAAALLLYL